MTYKNALLHNVAELVDEPSHRAKRIQRVPEATRVQLDEPAQLRTQNPDGCEIRFVLEGTAAEVTVSAKEPGTTVSLFFGPFSANQTWVLGAEPRTIPVELNQDQKNRIAAIPDDVVQGLPFHPSVARLVFYHRGIALLHDISGEIRPPRASELPSRSILTYGTSITHGASATQAHLTWAAQTAWRLGADLLNLGVGGACLCEAAYGDYIAGRDDWDLAVLSLSVNMIGKGFDGAGFRERVSYVVDAVSAAHPDKPVACVSIYPYFGDFDHTLHANAKATAVEFRTILRDIVTRFDRPNLHFIEGSSILDDIAGLTTDLIHPSDLGMIRMGENMAKALRPLL